MKPNSTIWLKGITLLLAISLSINGFSQQTEVVEQEESKHSLTLNADIVSRYVWRGLLYSPNPNIQPTVTYSIGGFSAGFWGSYAIASNLAEVDIFLSYTIGAFSVTLNDYYVEDETDLSLNNYFLWKNETTPHALEGSLAFGGTESFPLSISASTFFYGLDKDSVGTNYMSTYFELAYPTKIGGTDVNFFLGGTPKKGLYAQKAGIVNVGMGISKEIKLTDHFSLPISSSIVVNPLAKDVFLVFGITL
jgi:hypothetical protein